MKLIIITLILLSVIIITGCVGFQNNDPIKVTEVKNIENCITINTKVNPCTLVNLEIKNNQKESNYYLINRAVIVTKDGKQIGSYSAHAFIMEQYLDNNCNFLPSDFIVGFRLFPDASKKWGMCFPLVSGSDDPKLYVGSLINEEQKEFSFDLTPYIEGLNPSVSAAPVITPSADQKTFTNSIGMEFVQIPAGEFDMGSPSNEVGRWNPEGPVHRVKISKAFYMGKYEVTQKQWIDIMGTNPSKFKGDSLPVESVSWDLHVQEFIRKLNEKEGTNKYRLPSEAEWEYAARAGTTTKYSFGDDESKLGDYAWYDGNSDSKTHDVGQKKPNPWGLYDMHGNVGEWVQDIFQDNYNGAPTDGSSWEKEGNMLVIRGCSYYGNPAEMCRSAFRRGMSRGAGSPSIGFRLVRDL